MKLSNILCLNSIALLLWTVVFKIKHLLLTVSVFSNKKMNSVHIT